MTNEKPPSYRRWLVVFVAALGISVSSINTYSIGVFVRPLQAEFGWGRADIMLGLSIATVAGTLFAPFVGILVDKVGARTIGIAGAASYCLTTAMLGLAGAAIWTWWALWVLVASTTSLIKPMVWTAPIAGLFKTRQGMAMALALCGTGLASSLAPIFTESLINSYGWRVGYHALGGGWALASVPLLILFFYDGGSKSAVKQTSAERAELPGISARAGFRSRWFWTLLATTFLATMLIISLTVNFVPMLIDGGLSSGQAAQIAGLTGITSIIGRISTGYLIDRWHGPYIGSVAFLLPCIACLTLLLVGIGPWSAKFVAILLGLSIGAELDVVAYLSSRYFGRRNYGTLFGTITSMLSLGTAVGPPLAAYVYDSTGSYSLWWAAMLPVSVTASLLIGSMGDYPTHALDEHRTAAG
jgi:MFS family permease